MGFFLFHLVFCIVLCLSIFFASFFLSYSSWATFVSPRFVASNRFSVISVISFFAQSFICSPLCLILHLWCFVSFHFVSFRFISTWHLSKTINFANLFNIIFIWTIKIENDVIVACRSSLAISSRWKLTTKWAKKYIHTSARHTTDEQGSEMGKRTRKEEEKRNETKK